MLPYAPEVHVIRSSHNVCVLIRSILSPSLLLLASWLRFRPFWHDQILSLRYLLWVACCYFLGDLEVNKAIRMKTVVENEARKVRLNSVEGSQLIIAGSNLI